MFDFLCFRWRSRVVKLNKEWVGSCNFPLFRKGVPTVTHMEGFQKLNSRDLELCIQY